MVNEGSKSRYARFGWIFILLDAMVGDATLFAREDEVVAAWTLITPILEEWARSGEPEPYPAGGWGPDCSDRLIGEATRTEDRGRQWREP